MATPSRPTDNVRRDRQVGAVVASAAGDALGAPHEFGPAQPADTVLRMTGGGSFGWAAGEWTDDTQTALAVLEPLAEGAVGDDLLQAIERGLLRWIGSGPIDVGVQTRSVLGRAVRTGEPLAAVTAAFQAENPDSAGNGSLMRTGPVALSGLDREELVDLAGEISALTHAADDAVEACVLWTEAIRSATEAPSPTEAKVDWIGLVSGGLDLLPEDHRPLWRSRLDACATTPPESFTHNGWVVEALQAALSSLVHAEQPADQPCRHLRLAIERAVRIGGDTDTVAAITGSLAGAWWGATAVPLEWTRVLNGRSDYDRDALTGSDLDRLARLAAAGGVPDSIGWPGVESLLPRYARDFPSQPLAVALDDWVTIGNVSALSEQLGRVDVVVSLCRMGADDVPAEVEHEVVGLIDSELADNPNVGFVLADTVDFLARCAAEQRRVFLHCVRAENRTPAVAAAYLVRHAGLDPDAALERSFELTGHRPKPFFIDAVRSLAG